MSTYRTSPLADQATGEAEYVPQHAGHYYGGRVPAFMALAKATGGVYAEGFKSVADGLRATGLDFEVRMEHVQGVITETTLNDAGTELVERPKALALPNHRVTVAYPRDGREPFAICPTSSRYEPLQVNEALAFGDNIIDEGGQLVALGAYGRPVGARVYAAFNLPEGLTVGGKDPHDLVLTITTSFDRSTSTTVQVTPLRLMCTNQAPGLLGRLAPGWRMNHTKGARAKVAEAREALGLAFTARDAYAEEMERLLEVKMNENRAITYWRQVFGVPKDASEWSPRQATIAQAREDKLVEILGSPTCEFGRGTAYAAMQATTEYMDFFTPAKNDLRRAERVVTTSGPDQVKVRAITLALV